MLRDHPPHLPERVMLDSRPALIFVHGYYGSALRDAVTKRRVFLSLREVLLGRRAYSLFQEELATPPGPVLEPEGLFDRVSVLPLVYAVDVYGKFLHFAGNIPGVQLVPLVYDWRADLGAAVAQLDRIVHDLVAAGCRQIAIVGHSMGGLVASYYLGYGNQPFGEAQLNWEGARHVHRAYFLGVPFRGAFSIFRNLQRGANFTWNSRLLPAEAVASFPASYALLPPEGRFFDAASGREERRPLADYAFWREHGLGLLARESVPAQVRTARAEFTRKQLERARQLQDRLEFRGSPPPATLQVMNVFNHELNTVDAAFFDSERRQFLFDVDRLKPRGLDPRKLVGLGDGTVPAESSKLPAAFYANAELVDSALPHDRLFDEPRLKTELQRMFSERKE